MFITFVMPVQLHSTPFLSDTTDSVAVVLSRVCGQNRLYSDKLKAPWSHLHDGGKKIQTQN